MSAISGVSYCFSVSWSSLRNYSLNSLSRFSRFCALPRPVSSIHSPSPASSIAFRFIFWSFRKSGNHATTSSPVAVAAQPWILAFFASGTGARLHPRKDSTAFSPYRSHLLKCESVKFGCAHNPLHQLFGLPEEHHCIHSPLQRAYALVLPSRLPGRCLVYPRPRTRHRQALQVSRRRSCLCSIHASISPL